MILDFLDEIFANFITGSSTQKCNFTTKSPSSFELTDQKACDECCRDAKRSAIGTLCDKKNLVIKNEKNVEVLDYDTYYTSLIKHSKKGIKKFPNCDFVLCIGNERIILCDLTCTNDDSLRSDRIDKRLLMQHRIKQVTHQDCKKWGKGAYSFMQMRSTIDEWKKAGDIDSVLNIYPIKIFICGWRDPYVHTKDKAVNAMNDFIDNNAYHAADYIDYSTSVVEGGFYGFRPILVKYPTTLQIDEILK